MSTKNVGISLRPTGAVALTIPAASTVLYTTGMDKLAGIGYLAAEVIFVQGSGGTSVKIYVQTSLDGGATWIDIMCFTFATTTASKVQAVTSAVALAAAIVPTDGSLADNTILSGLFGDRFRVKMVVVGTYTASTIVIGLVGKS